MRPDNDTPGGGSRRSVSRSGSGSMRMLGGPMNDVALTSDERELLDAATGPSARCLAASPRLTSLGRKSSRAGPSIRPNLTAGGHGAARDLADAQAVAEVVARSA